ncbi:hypothetical protein TRIP_B200562 [uncultured Desulfatiglans sp.]|uniref:Uncharacterized protein n=1 Tax=Uncultured Desulfatiglans sp. TaxID=1748965 RepID=A0A653A441_UNCDX|nr:hypothetical protein TRIP_B200562 [uncultured Desulfatiglans sp.]
MQLHQPPGLLKVLIKTIEWFLRQPPPLIKAFPSYCKTLLPARFTALIEKWTPSCPQMVPAV